MGNEASVRLSGVGFGRALRLAIGASGLGCALIGATNLAGWILHFDIPWGQAMPNAGIGLTLDGLALVAIVWGWEKMALAGAAWSFLLGSSTLAEYLFSLDLHIDQALIRTAASGAYPGRIGPNVAFCFILTGIALWWASARERQWKWIGPTCLLSAVVFATGVLSIFRRLTGMSSGSGWTQVTPSVGALDAASGFTLLGLSLLLVVWWRGREQSAGFSTWLMVGVGAGGCTVALCFGQALSALNIDRNAEIAAELGRSESEIETVLNAAQGHLPLLLVGIGVSVTLLMVLMANQTLASRRQAVAIELGASKLAEETAQRRRVQESLDRFFALGADLLCIIGYDGFFKKVNAAWEQLLGYSAEELMAKPLIEFVDPEDRAATLAAAGRATSGHTLTEFPNRCICKDGSIRWLLWSSVGHQEAQEVYAVARDITAREKAEADLLELHRQLEQKVSERTAELTAVNKELEAFTYSVSHDLRAPLRHIDGYSQVLANELGARAEGDIAKALRSIRDGVRQMSQLIDGLLSLSRIGKVELQTRLTDPKSIVDEVVAELVLETGGRNIQWRLERLPCIICDPVLLKQVFRNLLSNSVKFTQPRQVAVIEVGSMEVKAETVMFVRDNGVGFSMKYAGKLFGVFQRLHRKEDFPGTGVGLATVQRIIHRHGGRIWTESELDRGTAFYFTLGSAPSAESRSTAEL